MSLQKDNAWRNEKYLAWVRRQPSVLGQAGECDPHHLKGHGFGGTVKAPDWAVIPLTRDEHAELHHMGYKAWEDCYGSQADYLLKFMALNFQEIQGFLSA